jgi:hypothetical protein
MVLLSRVCAWEVGGARYVAKELSSVSVCFLSTLPQHLPGPQLTDVPLTAPFSLVVQPLSLDTEVATCNNSVC